MECFDFMSCTAPVREQSIKAMADLIANNVDGMARVVGIDLDGFPDKCAGLLANLAMDVHDGRSLRDPATMASESIRAAEMSGMPLSIEVQDEMAQEAISLSEYWQGSKSLPSATVFWNMLQRGRFPLYRSHEWHARMAALAEKLSADSAYMRALSEFERAAEDLRAFAGRVLPKSDSHIVYPGPGEGVAAEGRKAALDAALPYCAAQDTYRTVRWEALGRLGIDDHDKILADTVHDRRAAGFFNLDALRDLMTYYGIDSAELNDMVEDVISRRNLQ